MPKPNITPGSPVSISKTVGDTPVKHYEVDPINQRIRGAVDVLDSEGGIIETFQTDWFDYSGLVPGVVTQQTNRNDGCEALLLQFCLDNGVLVIDGEPLTGTVG